MGSPFRIWVSCSYEIGSKSKSTVLVREFLIRRYMAKVQYFSNRHAFSISNILIPVLSVISLSFLNISFNKMNNNNTVGVVHKFEETPILLSQLLGDRPTKRGILLKEKLIYDPPRAGIKSKSAFYVLKLPSCTKALKLGRGLAGSDGILSRLGEYKTKYGNAKIMYLRTFTYTNASPENQPVSKFERK